jgi:hypothetical protein
MSNLKKSFPVGARVNCIWTDGETYPATVEKVTVKGVSVEFDDGEKAFVPVKELDAKVALRKRGRKPLEETLSEAEINKQVRDLLKELKVATDVDDKKRIRRALRRRGHAGGLGLKDKKAS